MVKKKKPINQRILALDAASKHTGYAIMIGNKVIKSGTWDLKPKTKYADLYSRIEQTIKQYDIDTIAVEDIFNQYDAKYYENLPKYSRSTYQVLCMVRGVIAAVAEINDIPLSAYVPLHIKNKLWGYNGGYSRDKQKERMIKVVTDMGYQLEQPTADDEADAIAVLIYHCRTNNVELHHPNGTSERHRPI